VIEELELLYRLSEIDSPSGDEGAFGDFLERILPKMVDGLKTVRLGDSLVVWRGKPQVALFAHIDTTGFTLGYDGDLIPLGSPDIRDGDLLRQVGGSGDERVVEIKEKSSLRLSASERHHEPGSRWVYDRNLVEHNGVISGPYLDNRAGVWAAIRTVAICENVAAAFTVGEETSGRGALICGQYLHSELNITQSIISDITWHTKHVRCGHGPAVSLRDRYAPRQRYLEKILRIAESSNIPFQREIESEGGSDGSYLQKSSIPMDWVFIGAPEQDAHSSLEKVHVSDLLGMAELMAYLVRRM
jgi:putative aminopeptidase FrvX